MDGSLRNWMAPLSYRPLKVRNVLYGSPLPSSGELRFNVDGVARGQPRPASEGAVFAMFSNTHELFGL